MIVYLEVAAVLIEWFVGLVQKLLFAVLGWIHLPPFPADFVNGINRFIGTVLDYGVGLISLIIPWRIVTIGLPIVVTIIAAKYLYLLVMWIVKKIPMLGMQ